MLYPEFHGGFKYDTYVRMQNELIDYSKDHKKIMIALDNLNKYSISPYVTHVLRIFIAKYGEKDITVIVEDDDKRSNYLKLFKRAMDNNYLRYVEHSYIDVGKYIRDIGNKING